MKAKVIKLATDIGKWVGEHSNILLTIGSCIGTGAVIFTTVRATRKYDFEIEQKSYEYEDQQVPKKEKAIIFAKTCWPAAVAAAGTIGCNVLNFKANSDKLHKAMLVSEFWRDSYEAYKSANRKRYGEEADRYVETDMIKEHYKEQFAGMDPSLIPGNGIIFIESWSGQVFRSSVDKIRTAERDFNEDLKGMDWCCLNDWLEYYLGLRRMHQELGDVVGFAERFDHDGMTIRLTPSNEIFATGETATLITYEDNLCTEKDFKVIGSV